MRALTFTQPWASLVAAGAKRIDTRSWGTRYRGPLAIHAAAGRATGVRAPAQVEAYASALPAGPLPRGAVVAVARLADCVRITPAFAETLSEQEIVLGDYAPGRWAWLLADVQPLPQPVPAQGKLGLWEWE